jgi:hypothetical protein
MLAGLMCWIGVLPLCMHLEKNRVPIEDETLETLIKICHRMIGVKLLQNWQFPQEIIEVVAGFEDNSHSSNYEPMPDYVDVVIMFANLQTSQRVKFVDWKNIPTIRRLCLSPDECKTFMEQNQQSIGLVEELLGITTQTKVPTVTQSNQASINVKSSNTDEPEKSGGLFSFVFNLWK